MKYILACLRPTRILYYILLKKQSPLVQFLLHNAFRCYSHSHTLMQHVHIFKQRNLNCNNSHNMELYYRLCGLALSHKRCNYIYKFVYWKSYKGTYLEVQS